MGPNDKALCDLADELSKQIKEMEDDGPKGPDGPRGPAAALLVQILEEAPTSV